MQEFLRFKEELEFTKKHPKERFYHLELPWVRVGVLYVTPQSYSFGWSGSLDFSLLDEEVLGRLPLILNRGDKNSRFIIPNEPGQVLATFILETDDLVECDLALPAQREQYTQIINDPSNIFFARYDVHASGAGSTKFAFTAEKAYESENHGAELAILLTRRQWPDELGEWVIGHHQAKNLIWGQIEPSAITKTIAKLAPP